MHYERKNASQRGPASKVRAVEIQPCMDAWHRFIQTIMPIHAANACFKFTMHPEILAGPKCIWLAWKARCRAICGSQSHCPNQEPSSTPNLFWAHLPSKTIWLLMIT